ncbi:TolB amino-terminal domain-containing protein [Rhizobiales bacterium GAS191]|nr:TolB amino-terminal domain-containing protein [Rhizobiales bacterium GAS191]
MMQEAATPRVERRLAAIMAADVVGYSRLMGADEEGTLAQLKAHRRGLADPKIKEHRGRIVKTTGDGMLVEFVSPVEAVRCAVEIQHGMVTRNSGVPQDKRITFRVGINLGDVIAEKGDLFGDGVNVAARLETLCEPGGIAISRTVRDQIRDKLPFVFADAGEHEVKNISRPVRVYALTAAAIEALPEAQPMGSPQRIGRRSVASIPAIAIAALASLIVLAGGFWWLHSSDITSSRAVVSATADKQAPPAATAAFVPPAIGLAHAPPLSLVVLPFSNLSGDQAQDYLVDGITEDLTTDLSQVQGTLVIARDSAFTYKGRVLDVRQIGDDLGVRYVVKGSVRRISGSARVNVDLVSTETGANLWADRFDIDLADPNAGEDEIVARIGGELNVQLVDIESARAVRERPSNPQAFDLILQARALTNQPPSPQRLATALGFYGRALESDPSSVVAMLGIADTLTRQLNTYQGMWIGGDALDRTASLIDAVQRRAPNSEGVMVSAARLLEAEERWPELIPAARRLVEAFPNRVAGYDLLSSGYRLMGQQDQALPLYQKAIRLDPRGPNLFNRYGYQGFSLMLSGRYKEAITSFERSLAANPDAPKEILNTRHRNLGAAYALNGQLDKARLEIAESERLWPFNTVRMNAPFGSESPAFAAQIERFEGGLRLAGQRDHADEYADFGVPPDDALHAIIAGHTPTKAPGTMTTNTAELPDLLIKRRPLVIDAMTSWWGRSIPGAIGLKFVGLGGGTFSDPTHERLRKKMEQLTASDRSKPIVAVGFNSERFDGYNLALRLVHMGFTEVYWYRGGREAWEVAGLPVENASEQAW